MEINAAEFRTKCFKLLDQVQATHREIIITKRGQPIAKLVHIDQAVPTDPLIGALKGVGRTLEDLTQPLTSEQDWELD